MNYEERIARLEQQNRRLVRFLAMTVLATLSTSLIAATQLVGITARKVEVRDQQGKITIALQENGDLELDGTLKIKGTDIVSELSLMRNRIFKLEQKGPRAWLYFHTKNIITPGSGNPSNEYNISNVTRIGTGNFRITFKGNFGNSSYVALSSSTGKVGLTRNTPTQIDVLCEEPSEVWLAFFGDFTPNP